MCYATRRYKILVVCFTLLFASLLDICVLFLFQYFVVVLFFPISSYRGDDRTLKFVRVSGTFLVGAVWNMHLTRWFVYIVIFIRTERKESIKIWCEYSLIESFSHERKIVRLPLGLDWFFFSFGFWNVLFELFSIVIWYHLWGNLDIEMFLK